MSAGPRFYASWDVTYSAARPVTGTWRAERHGVGMCAGSKAGIERMIDIRNAEERNRRHDAFRQERVAVAGEYVREYLGGRTPL